MNFMDDDRTTVRLRKGDRVLSFELGDLQVYTKYFDIDICKDFVFPFRQ